MTSSGEASLCNQLGGNYDHKRNPMEPIFGLYLLGFCKNVAVSDPKSLNRSKLTSFFMILEDVSPLI